MIFDYHTMVDDATRVLPNLSRGMTTAEKKVQAKTGAAPVRTSSDSIRLHQNAQAGQDNESIRRAQQRRQAQQQQRKEERKEERSRVATTAIVVWQRRDGDRDLHLPDGTVQRRAAEQGKGAGGGALSGGKHLRRKSCVPVPGFYHQASAAVRRYEAKGRNPPHGADRRQQGGQRLGALDHRQPGAAAGSQDHGQFCRHQRGGGKVHPAGAGL